MEKEFKRKCKNCGTEFVTKDKRKLYDTRRCGQNFRAERWRKRASAALKKETKKAA